MLRMLIKIGIAILLLAILGPFIGDILVLFQRIIFGAVIWIFSLPFKVILIAFLAFFLLKFIVKLLKK
jgi:hypothetical protein